MNNVVGFGEDKDGNRGTYYRSPCLKNMLYSYHPFIIKDVESVYTIK